jgi:uncharacterized protein YggL (DUF469 family)
MTAPCPVLGYRVAMNVSAGMSSSSRGELRQAWLEFLAGRGLYCSGGGVGRIEYVVASEASQATENDRAATRAWLESRRELDAWRVADLEELERVD